MVSRKSGRPSPFITALLVTVFALPAPPALAQAENQAAARALFEEARRLIKDGDYAGACPKLEAAAKIEVAPGVLLNLGDCYEHSNRTASAWAEFAAAEAVAARAGRSEQEQEANRRKTLLGPKLSRLVVRVAGDVPGLAIHRDGVPLDRGVWGVALPVDPGQHEVVAGAEGRISWSTSVTVAEPGDIVVDVPTLESLPVESAPAFAIEARGQSFWTPPRVAETAAVGAGVVAIGVAGILALVAKGKENEAEKELGSAQINDSLSAVYQGNVATGLAIGGAVVAVAGIVLLIVAPRSRARVTANEPPLVLGGTF